MPISERTRERRTETSAETSAKATTSMATGRGAGASRPAGIPPLDLPPYTRPLVADPTATRSIRPGEPTIGCTIRSESAAPDIDSPEPSSSLTANVRSYSALSNPKRYLHY
jgi:hypothetical protein